MYIPPVILGNVIQTDHHNLRICESPHARSLFCIICTSISATLHDSLPHGAGGAPLCPAQKLHYGPEPRHPRQRAHKGPDGFVLLRWCGGEHGDERGEEGGFERGTEECREGRGVDCLPASDAKGQRTETESRAGDERWGRARTFSRAQRAAVSVVGMRSHERVNSKSVRGVAAGVGAARAGAGAGADGGARASVGGGGTGDAPGAGTSRDLNTVSLPDMRKMPPPTRPTDFTSRACFASLKDDGGSVDFCAVEAGAGAGAGAAGVDFASGGVDVEGCSVRELMGFRRSLSVRRGVLADVKGGGCDCGVSSSTMAIGMRRRFGGAVVEEEEEGEDAAGRGVEI